MLQMRILDFIIRKVNARRSYYQVIRELSVYSDRELTDLGLCRADIHRIAADSARHAEETAKMASQRRIGHVSHVR
jgi:uncharacterized protein YjiS (DUF1127 family)